MAHTPGSGLFQSLLYLSHSAGMPSGSSMRPATSPSRSSRKKIKGKGSQRLRDRPHHRPWPPQYCLSVCLSVPPSSSSPSLGQILRGLRATHKIIPFFRTCYQWRALWPRPHKGKVYWTRHHHCDPLCSRCCPLPPSARHRPPRPQVRFSLSPLSLYLLYRPENILYRSKDPDSDIVIVDFRMCVPLHLPTSFCSSFHRAKFLNSPGEQLASLAGYFAPEFIKNIGPEIWFPGRIASTCIHKQNTSSFPLCTSIITPPLLCGYILFVSTIPLSLPSKTLTPKLNFRVRTGTLFPAKSNSLSNLSPPSIHFIIPPPRMLYTTLFLPPSPPPTYNPTSIYPPHSDKLRESHNTVPRLVSGPPTCLATLLLLLEVFRALKVGHWLIKIRIHASSLKRRRRRRRTTLVKAMLFLVPEPSLPWTKAVGNNLGGFLALLRVK